MHPYCIEINGHDSGLAGVQKIDKSKIDPTQRIMADIRNTRNKKLRNKVNEAKEITEDLDSGEFPSSQKGKEIIAKYLKASIAKEPLLPKAYVNDEFIQEVADDKSLQEELIPEENRPRHLYPGDDTFSKTGYWVAKPKLGITGKGVSIIANDEIGDVIDELGGKLWGDFVVQEFIPSAPAQAAGEDRAEHTASLRLLVDFRYLENNEIEPTYLHAYQRVNSKPLDLNASFENRNKSAVTNYSRGAESYPATKEELNSTYEVAEQIIINLAERFKEHKEDLPSE